MYAFYSLTLGNIRYIPLQHSNTRPSANSNSNSNVFLRIHVYHSIFTRTEPGPEPELEPPRCSKRTIQIYKMGESLEAFGSILSICTRYRKGARTREGGVRPWPPGCLLLSLQPLPGQVPHLLVLDTYRHGALVCRYDLCPLVHSCGRLSPRLINLVRSISLRRS